ncbi:MAG: phosphoglycolate phosphatase [Betaproteobacteria bacterium]|nr:phosphoglycolate phosphatase [Betaproteobacteria bacterium]
MNTSLSQAAPDEHLSTAPVEAPTDADLLEDATETQAESGAEPDGAPKEPRKIRYRAKPKHPLPVAAKAIVLDLDGTLADTAGDLITAVNKMRAALGFAPLEALVVKNFIGKGIANLVSKSLKDAVGEVGPTALKVAVANFERQYETCFTDTSPLFPGVLDGLSALRGAGFRLGCVTNKAARFTLPLLQKLGLTDYFEIVVSGDTVAEKKPHPLPLKHAAAFFGCATREMVMIGDSINDAEAARAAGSPVFIVPYGYNEGQELRGLDCDAFIDDIPAALKYLKMPALPKP